MPKAGDTPGRVARLRALVVQVRTQADALTDRARRNPGVLGKAMKAIDRDADIGGNILAGALAYRLFIFALPLSFFIISTLRLLDHFFTVDVEAAAEQVGMAGSVASQVADTGKPSSSIWIALTSLMVLVYVTRVLFRTLVVVHALAWRSPVGWAKRNLGGLTYFGGAVAGQLLLVGAAGAIRRQTPLGGALALGAFLVIDAALWLMVSLHLPRAVVVGWRDLVPGAVLYALGVLGVQIFNTYILGLLLKSKASTYGSLGAAAAVLLGFFLLGRVVVGAAVLDATLADRRREDELGRTDPDDPGNGPGSSGR